MNHWSTPEGAALSAARFMTLKQSFFTLARAHRPDLVLLLDPKSLGPKSLAERKNWDPMFAPASWAAFRGGAFGVHWILAYRPDRAAGIDQVRLALGVERPIAPASAREAFKADVVARMEADGVDLPEWTVWRPELGARKKLLVGPTVAMAEGAERELLRQFVDAEGVVPIVAGALERWAATSSP